MRFAFALLLASTAAFGPSAAVTPINRRDYRVASDAVATVAAGFNNDGIPDLAVASSNASKVSVLLGKGNGLFASSSIDSTTGAFPESITAGDFNNDGRMDLVVIDLANLYSTFGILYGNGDGGYHRLTCRRRRREPRRDARPDRFPS